jgi:hypothetical protein
VLEVHPVDPRDRGRDGDDRRPGGDAADVLVLAHAELRQIRRQDAREHIAVVANARRVAAKVILDIAKVGRQLVRNLWIDAARQRMQRLEQGHDGAVEVEHGSLQPVDPLGRILTTRGENAGLDVPDGRIEAVDDRPVVVDDAVDDRMQCGSLAQAQEVGTLLQLQAHVVQLGLSVANRDEEAVADEEEDLAEVDRLVLCAPAGRLEHEEERIAVDLELRPLMRLDRVLDGELVQVELAPDRVELVLRGLEQAEPGEGPVAPAGLISILERQLSGSAATLFIDRAIDEHDATVLLTPARSPLFHPRTTHGNGCRPGGRACAVHRAGAHTPPAPTPDPGRCAVPGKPQRAESWLTKGSGRG